ncbi:hypothetical protein DPMN_176616 [Dreissena polymorpha]|uniref:Uncharacterized protein n=1 Tax=Dreissena polymorpha TaxID=45954 RepID=A0A9D4EBN4_DREPO|nr:hypothetical protein DPMN_176616 [Dreissena polymorpha]
MKQARGQDRCHVQEQVYTHLSRQQKLTLTRKKKTSFVLSEEHEVGMAIGFIKNPSLYTKRIKEYANTENIF